MNYSVSYINESLFNAESIAEIHKLIFGSMFILSGVKKETVNILKNSVRLPIISSENISGTLRFDYDLSSRLYKHWSKNISVILNNHEKTKEVMELFKSKDFTDFPYFTTHAKHYMNPIQGVINRLRGLYKSVNM